MAALKVLLIDDDPRMEALLRGPVGLPPALLVRDPAGIFEPEPDKHGLVLLNAEFQKSFGLCRRFKKKRETASVDVAFFTFSHDREHLRILGEHRVLPTHADHYLLPPVTPERALDLLTKTIGAFSREVVETPPPFEIEAEVEDLEADVLGDDVDVADDDGPERTRDDLAAPPDLPPSLAPVDDDEFADVPVDTDEPTPVAVEIGALGALGAFDAVAAGDAPISQPEMSMGGFQADRLSSVETYVANLHGKFARMEDQIEARAAEIEAERAAMRAERDAAVAEARRSADALADEVRRLTTELEAGQAATGRAADFDHLSNELATLRADAEWARTEAERRQAEMTRLRAEADRALGESVRSRGEIERLRTEVTALTDRAAKAEAALAEHKEVARAESLQLNAHLAALEADVSRSAHRLATLGETLRQVRPGLSTLLELSRDLDLEGVPDADGVPPGFDDR